MVPNFYNLLELEPGFCEAWKTKKEFVLDLPAHIGVFILNYAQLSMLQFYCDLVNKYCHLSLYEINKTDTVNLYITLRGNSVGELVPLERRQAFQAEKHQWFLTPHLSRGKRAGVQLQIYWYQNDILVFQELLHQGY